MRILDIIILFFLFTNILYCKDKKPVEILADTMEWNKQLGQAIAIGNAKAIQGESILKADKIIAILDKANNQKITQLLANGNVKFLRDKQLATGDKATYHLNQDKVIITGNVKLERDNNIIKGEKLIIDFITGLSKMEGSKSNQKVKMKYITE